MYTLLQQICFAERNTVTGKEQGRLKLLYDVREASVKSVLLGESSK
jgi:hypothetical protein